MPSRSTAKPGTHRPTAAKERPERCRIHIVPVKSGVAEGRTRQRGDTVRTECWTLFTSREEFDACAADDPLRFKDPLQFGRIKTEADDVFERRR
jgi:hypothetical protein